MPRVVPLRRGHLYLLSDNRHWSSVAWRHLLARYPWQRYAYIPVYGAALALLRRALGAQPALIVLGYAAATALVLVPSPLIEARYFVLPYLLLRLHIRPAPSPSGLAAEAIVYLAVNAAVFYMFLYRPFFWVVEPGLLQRYMW